MTVEIIDITKSRLFHVSTVVFLLQLNSWKISKWYVSLSETCFTGDIKDLFCMLESVHCMCWAKIWRSTNSILLIISSWSWAADCWCHWETSAGASPETLDYFHNLHKPSWWVDENMWAFFWKIKSIKLSCSLCSFSNQAHIQQSYYSDYWKSTKLNFLNSFLYFWEKC